MASIRTKHLGNGQSAYLVRYRASDGKERSRQFARQRDAQRFAHLTEVSRGDGSFVDPRLGKITVAE
ncbi:MAG: site-specific integrase, partial [Ilumatobacteraceae bacterium]